MLIVTTVVYLSCKKEEDDNDDNNNNNNNNNTADTTQYGCTDTNAMNYSSEVSSSNVCIYDNSEQKETAEQTGELTDEMVAINDLADSYFDTDSITKKSFTCIDADVTVLSKTVTLTIPGSGQGTDGYCTFPDGKARKGEITIVYSSLVGIRNNGSTRTIDLSGYTVADYDTNTLAITPKYKLDATITITNTGSGDGDEERTIEISGPGDINGNAAALLEMVDENEIPTGVQHLLEGTFILTVTSDNGTAFNRLDDDYSLEIQSATAKSTGGEFISNDDMYSVITVPSEPLVKRGDCDFIVSGIIAMQLDNQFCEASTTYDKTWTTLDFDPDNPSACGTVDGAGSAPCDRKAEIVMGDFSDGNCFDIPDIENQTDFDVCGQICSDTVLTNLLETAGDICQLSESDITALIDQYETNADITLTTRQKTNMILLLKGFQAAMCAGGGSYNLDCSSLCGDSDDGAPEIFKRCYEF